MSLLSQLYKYVKHYSVTQCCHYLKQSVSTLLCGNYFLTSLVCVTVHAALSTLPIGMVT
uniref:Uncharacterized protein n=1 Tax=Octopus bimaculoides TaxID=37653 RepID=A0A0L8GV76_OCTBM